VGGKVYMATAKGGLQPVETIKPQHLLEDEVVRTTLGYALPLSEQVASFKQQTFDRIAALEALLEQEYGAKVGGPKGNKTLQTFDGLMMVEIKVADHIDFGPELQVAKSLLDECLTEWAADSRPEIRTIVTRAFNTDKAGKINQREVLRLLPLEIEDERWRRAMDAIRDAIRVVGSRRYVRFSWRDAPDAAWQPVTIDLAKA
jgi:hypothetical protein